MSQINNRNLFNATSNAVARPSSSAVAQPATGATIADLQFDGVSEVEARGLSERVVRAISSKTNFHRIPWNLSLAMKSDQPQVSFTHPEGRVRVYKFRGTTQFTVGDGGPWAPAIHLLHTNESTNNRGTDPRT